MLSERYVEAIFTRMLVRYGAAWLRMWDEVDLGAVKADWANELDGLSSDSVRYGLEYLPLDRPPTVSQFKAICLKRRQSERLLPAPRPDIARLIEEAAKLCRPGQLKATTWIEELQDRSGETLTIAQREILRGAQRTAPEPLAVGAFRPIPRNVLPPGMRGDICREPGED